MSCRLLPRIVFPSPSDPFRATSSEFSPDRGHGKRRTTLQSAPVDVSHRCERSTDFERKGEDSRIATEIVLNSKIYQRVGIYFFGFTGDSGKSPGSLQPENRITKRCNCRRVGRGRFVFKSRCGVAMVSGAFSRDQPSGNGLFSLSRNLSTSLRRKRHWFPLLNPLMVPFRARSLTASGLMSRRTARSRVLRMFGRFSNTAFSQSENVLMTGKYHTPISL